MAVPTCIRFFYLTICAIQIVWSQALDTDPYFPNSPHAAVQFGPKTKEEIQSESDNKSEEPLWPDGVGPKSKWGMAQEILDEGRDPNTLPSTVRKFDKPLILWWYPGLFPHQDYTTIECSVGQCRTTNNRHHLQDPKTRGVILYGTDFAIEDLPLPRLPQHEWALIHEESPMNNHMLTHYPLLRQFNHTATFRRESDFPLTSQNIYSLDYLTEKQPVPTDIKNALKAKDDLAPIVYIASHCDISSDRDRYVLELMNHIDVDSIGSCIHNKDIPLQWRDPVESMEADLFLKHIASYKFHLAFENAICDDYMTEKLYRSLHVGSVPIYRGSQLAKDYMPNNHSIIMADDFASPKDLAEFIKKLDSDDAAYETYLEYKTKGITNQYMKNDVKNRKWEKFGANEKSMFSSFECHVCDKLVERMAEEAEHKEDPSYPAPKPHFAESSHLSCPQPYTSIGNPDDYEEDVDPWMKMGWIEDYWNGLDKALAIRDMLDAKEKDPTTYHKYWEKVLDRQSNRKIEL
ncbi:unnamed protein product [Owenia fusiformis]|uniref:Fucosyltransferase n=1 Tax=Owenia fusiformis TaxID=6347 RepID=A0A8J1U6R9_OWEFU|nr:unnamed protein product [Owenia fusiformis]